MKRDRPAQSSVDAGPHQEPSDLRPGTPPRVTYIAPFVVGDPISKPLGEAILRYGREPERLAELSADERAELANDALLNLCCNLWSNARHLNPEYLLSEVRKAAAVVEELIELCQWYGLPSGGLADLFGFLNYWYSQNGRGVADRFSKDLSELVEMRGLALLEAKALATRALAFGNNKALIEELNCLLVSLDQGHIDAIEGLQSQGSSCAPHAKGVAAKDVLEALGMPESSLRKVQRRLGKLRDEHGLVLGGKGRGWRFSELGQRLAAWKWPRPEK